MKRDRTAPGSHRKAPSFERILRLIHQTHKRLSRQDGSGWSLLFSEVSRQGVEAFEGRAPVVWTTAYVFPMELLAALGLIPVDFEIYAGLLSTARQTAPLLRAADRASVPQDTCTVHRLAMGAAILDQLPRPNLLVSTTHYCDGKAKVNEYMAQRYGVDYLLLDMPMEDTPAARAYLESQLWEIFQRLADLAGKRSDQALLSEPIRHFNEMTLCLRRFNEVRKGTPSPILPNNRGFSVSFMGSLLYGTPHAAEIYRRLEAEFETARQAGAIPSETLRFLWLMASPTYDVPIFSFLEGRGGRIVMEEFSHCYWEPVDERAPMASIARRMLANPFMGPVERRAETAAMLAREYGVAAALHFGHLPCRQSNGALQVIKDRLEAQGVRLVNLEADLSDPANFPKERIEDQLLAVWEILQPRSPGSKG